MPEIISLPITGGSIPYLKGLKGFTIYLFCLFLYFKNILKKFKILFIYLFILNQYFLMFLNYFNILI